MTKLELKEYIRNLEKDVGILKKEQCHARTSDLQMMVMTEDLPELLKFVKQVQRVFNFEMPEVTGNYSKGYYDGIRQVESEIFNE